MNQTENTQEQPETTQEYEEDGSQFEPYETPVTPEMMAIIEKHGIESFENLDDHFTEEEREAFANKHAGL